MAGVVAELQLGKNGITDNFLHTLNGYFEKHKTVKIHVLKSARQNKEDVKNHAEKIVEHLGNKFTYKTIGFTIILRKWRNPVR